MKRLIWNKKSLSTLDLIFLRTVRDNMREDGSVVRFGVTGEGIKPNYQINFMNGVIQTRNGLSHDHHKTDEFDPANISDQEFTYADITDAYYARRQQ